MKELLKKIPKVDELLRSPALAEATESYGDRAVTEAVRAELDLLRQGILKQQITAMPELSDLYPQIVRRVQGDSLPSFRRVINGTGIILHTNLGRACLSEQAARAVYEASKSYSNLEYDLSTGKRGSRYSHVEEILCRLTGAESALVVNNNAAAVLLVLSALTAGGQVPVSRGELVEIGGSFRVPEIMEACGAQLKEVGATNKTHLRDYEKAIHEQTKALMKVHTSNYRIIGFSETPALSDLVELGHKYNLPVIEDLGSGCLLDLKSFGIHDEPSVQDSIRAGVDVVSFSGDKLLGGPQAGIILGKKKYLDILKKHPLNRAMRVDKMTLAALESTLQSYEKGCSEEVPIIGMLGAKPEELRQKAALLANLLTAADIPVDILSTESQVGGGSVPNKNLPSYAIAFSGDVNALEETLRLGVTPIIGRIHDGKYLLDVRTLFESDFPTIVEAIREAVL
jgi:L-seryl-tRNA(Ser) seleniumtransferase